MPYISEDERRLPEGFTRVGYDADTQVYSYTDKHGNYWEGAPGSQYGQLHRAGTRHAGITTEEAYLAKENDKASWAYMFPFLVIVGAFLLLIITLTRSGSSKDDVMPAVRCSEGQEALLVASGDSCWSIADRKGTSVNELIRLNEGLDCDNLKAGRKICVPESTSTKEVEYDDDIIG